MFTQQTNLAKVFFSMGVTTFLFLGVFGLFCFGMHMGMGSMVSTSDCPLMVGSSLCTMTPLQHLSLWQNMFGTIPTQTGITLALLFSLCVLFVFVYVQKNTDVPPGKQRRLFSYFNSLEYIPPVRSFQELFSAGILNPKSF